MSQGKALTEDQKRILAEMHLAGKTFREIGKQVDLSTKSVFRCVHLLGLPPRLGRHCEPADRFDQQIKTLRETGCTYSDIAAKIGISKTTVCERILALGMRQYKQAKAVKHKEPVAKYHPAVDDCLRLASLLDMLTYTKRKTMQASEKIVSSVLHAVNKGRVAL